MKLRQYFILQIAYTRRDMLAGTKFNQVGVMVCAVQSSSDRFVQRPRDKCTIIARAVRAAQDFIYIFQKELRIKFAKDKAINVYICPKLVNKLS